MAKHAIFSNKLAKAAGPFSPAIRIEGVIYVSGQIGQDVVTGKVVDGGVKQPTEQIFANLSAVPEVVGEGFVDVVRVGIYLTDMASFAAMNGIYAKHFFKPYPARTTIGLAELPLGAVVEVHALLNG